jgi:hypothetical protein
LRIVLLVLGAVNVGLLTLHVTTGRVPGEEEREEKNINTVKTESNTKLVGTKSIQTAPSKRY